MTAIVNDAFHVLSSVLYNKTFSRAENNPPTYMYVPLLLYVLKCRYFLVLHTSSLIIFSYIKKGTLSVSHLVSEVSILQKSLCIWVLLLPFYELLPFSYYAS